MPFLNLTDMLQLRTIYTKTVRSIIAKIPNPLNPNASEGIKLNDGSLFISLNSKVTDTSQCPIIPNKCGGLMPISEIEANTKIASKYNSIGKLCGRFGISRSFAINRLGCQKEKLVKEETERIDKMSDKRKRGLLIRRLIRKDRYESF